jgi:chromosome segregation ATPase
VDTVSRPPIAASPPPTAPSGASDEALDQLLRQIVEGFFVLTDGQGALSKWSEPAELLFGYEADEALMEPFFGKLVPTAGLSPHAESWRTFLETGETPGASGRMQVDALKPGGGTFAMEAVFVPVKLDEGFDFSLFLEDLGFELPMDMMLLRMRQQHPVVVRALRGALESATQSWDGVRTAGTLVAFRPLEPTPWMDVAMERREAEQAEAEAELQSRIEALEAPSVSGTDVYDLDDARAVIDRLRWATERIEELEERSRVADAAVQEAADARVRAEAAERAALDVKAEVSEALVDRPVDPAGEADRLELLARLERVERSAGDAAEAAAAQRLAAEAERARATELDAQRAELLARLEQVEQVAGSTSVAEAVVAEARAELTTRMEALERTGAEGAELAARMEALERARAQEAEELRAEIERLRTSTDLRADLDALHAQVGELQRVRDELDTLRERAEAHSAVMRHGQDREAAAARDVHATREELSAALRRVEELTEETARIRAHLDSAPEDAGLSHEERQKLEAAAAGVAEARAGIEAIRTLTDELRTQSAQLREEGAHLNARLVELGDRDDQVARDQDGLRREHEELRGHLDDLRRERDEARAHLRDAVRLAEEARALAERGPADDDDRPAQATADEVLAARARLDELVAQIEATEERLEETRAETTGARAEIAEVRETADDALKAAREAAERADVADRANENALAQISTQAAIIEEVGALARSAQHDAGESRADAGEARAVVARLQAVVTGVREQVEHAVAEAAGAREHAAAAGETAESVRQLAAGVGDAAREAAATAVQPVGGELAELRERLDAVGTAVAELRAETGSDPELEAALDAIRADVQSLRAALDSAASSDSAAVEAIGARLDAVEDAIPSGIDARVDSLHEGLAGALGKLDSVTVDIAAARTETGAGREALEQRLADTAAELMAARTDAEQARRGLEGLREELDGLREYAAAARAEAAAAKEAAASARKADTEEGRALHELRTEVHGAIAKLADLRTGFEEARQAAVAARRDAEQARVAAEKAGAVNEATTEKFTEVWQRMLTTGSGVHHAPSGVRPAPVRPAAAPKKEEPPSRNPEAGFDDDPRPLARLDVKGKFTQLNPGFVKLVGYQEHEFSKATWPSVLDRKVYSEQSAQLAALVGGRSDRVAVDSTYMHGQGLMVRVTGVITLVRDAAGQPAHLLMAAEPAGPVHD